MEGTSQEHSIFCKCKYDVGEEFSDSKSHWFFSPVDGTLRIYNLSLEYITCHLINPSEKSSVSVNED